MSRPQAGPWLPARETPTLPGTWAEVRSAPPDLVADGHPAWEYRVRVRHPRWAGDNDGPVTVMMESGAPTRILAAKAAIMMAYSRPF